MSKLIPCDCGKSDVRMFFGEHAFSGTPNKYWVICCGCGKETITFYDTMEQATRAWNKKEVEK